MQTTHSWCLAAFDCCALFAAFWCSFAIEDDDVALESTALDDLWPVSSVLFCDPGNNENYQNSTTYSLSH